MATHDYIIANASGAAVRADLNNALAAIVSNNSNATAPATTYAYQWWADTTANQLKLRNSANDDWIVIQELDGTMLMEDGTAASPGLSFASDTDTGLFRPAANQLGIATNGVERVEFGTTEVVFNDSGEDIDFRVEGDAEPNLLFVDAGNDRVGIGTNAPGGDLHIQGAAGSSGRIYLTDGDATGAANSALFMKTGTETQIRDRQASSSMSFWTADTERVFIDSSGNVGIGTDSPEAALHVKTSGVGIPAAGAAGSMQVGDGHSFGMMLGTNSGGTGYIQPQRNDGNTTTYNLAINPNGGNVGIGTDSPSALLHLAGNAPYITFEDDDNNQDWQLQATAWFALRNETTSSELLRVHSGGEVTVGTSSLNPGVGNTIYGASINGDGYISASRDNPLAYFNRPTNDGILVEFLQAGTKEGQIVVTGTSVTYGGGHLARWSQLTADDTSTNILRGTVLSNLDEMCEWAYEAQDAVLYTEEDELPEGVSVGDVKTPAKDAGVEDNEQLNRTKISDVEGDPNVAGVFVAYDTEDDVYTGDFYCAMTGDFVIRIAEDTTVARGDLLMSAGDGTAKPQDDDIVRSKTIAKVTSTTVSATYADGSYCVPCVLMAC